MSTREIEREEWSAFFSSFTRRHAGWFATVEVLAPDLGDQEAIRDAPFSGITWADGGIEIIVQRDRERHAAHFVESPQRLWLKQADDGSDEVLEIEGPGGATLLRFRSAVPTDAIGAS